MPQRIVFSEPVLSTSQPYPSHSASHGSNTARSLQDAGGETLNGPKPVSALTFDLFTMTWLLSFLAFFFVTDNYMRTQRHNQAKWYDLQTSKAAYIYECKPASSREDEGQTTQEALQEEPGFLSRAWDGLAMGASLMMVA